MKKPLAHITLLSFAFSLMTFPCKAQNLVPNPSFEDTVACPDGAWQLYKSQGWNANINSSDFFHKCSSSNAVSIPNNTQGYQFPPDTNCNAFAGFLAAVGISPGSVECFGRALTSPLIVGQLYYASFKVSLAYDNWSLNCATDKIGMLFTNMFYGDTGIVPSPFLKNYAHIFSTQIISDTTNWVTISGSFIADSAYQYVMIGQFFDTSNVNYSCWNTNPKFSYYFVDDVCVSSDSSTCNQFTYTCSTTSIQSYFDKSFKFLPNPSNDNFFIQAPDESEYNLVITDISGKEIYQFHNLKHSFQMNTTNLREGFYFVKIESEINRIIHKLLINH